MTKPASSRRIAALGASALAAVLFLSACTTVPQSAPFASENSSAKKQNPIAEAPSQDWWQAFGDPQLSALMNEAFENSPTLAMAEARLHQAEAITGVAKASVLPTLSLNAKADEFKQSYNYLFPKAFLPDGYADEGQVTFNFDWDLDFWGKNRAAITAATNTARAAAADAAQARLVLTSAIASAYVELDRLYQSRDLADRAVTIRQDSANLVKQKLDNGVSNQAEYNQAAAGVSTNRSTSPSMPSPCWPALRRTAPKALRVPRSSPTPRRFRACRARSIST
jgi:outer membrane protein TolC